uniref:t-SNARE coiled-coil homology domain-containing protein n=1 Tax=Caenorhabditis tropicalis TaxID=1561998 RepID=A0A1I7TBM5_9PELO
MQQLSGMEEGRGSAEDLSRNTTNGSLEHFLQSVDSIRHVLMMLNRDREAIRLEQEESLAAGYTDQAKCRRVNEHSDQFIKQARVVRKRLSEASAELEKYPQSNVGTGRARHEQVRSLLDSFRSIMTKFNEDQTSYKQRAGRKVAAYLRKQDIQVSDEKIDEVIENGSLLGLTRSIQLGVEQKKALCNDVQTRATDLRIMEKQIQEVEELFEDLHNLVQQQGETIDRIETSVCAAGEYAREGERNVKSAVEMRRKGQKWKFVMAFVLVIVVLILLAIFKFLSPI